MPATEKHFNKNIQYLASILYIRSWNTPQSFFIWRFLWTVSFFHCRKVAFRYLYLYALIGEHFTSSCPKYWTKQLNREMNSNFVLSMVSDCYKDSIVFEKGDILLTTCHSDVKHWYFEYKFIKLHCGHTFSNRNCCAFPNKYLNIYTKTLNLSPSKSMNVILLTPSL